MMAIVSDPSVSTRLADKFRAMAVSSAPVASWTVTFGASATAV